MKTIKVLPFDPRMELSGNYVIETQDVTDLARDWYRPDYAPFYTVDFELYDGDGMLLKRGRDYEFKGLSDSLVFETGKNVYQFFRIMNPNLNNKGGYRIKYRSLGNTGFPQSLIRQMADDLLNNRYWIDWDNQVLGKPETYPSLQHWHDVASEVANWDQFIDFAQQHLDFILGNRKAHWERNQHPIALLGANFDQQRDEFWNKLQQHDQDYDQPHGLTRKDFPLTEIMNEPLATVKQDIDGVSSRSFTTPAGLAAAVKQARKMGPAFVKGGDYPSSQFRNVSLGNVVRTTLLKTPNAPTSGTWYKRLNDDLVFVNGYGNEDYATSHINHGDEVIVTSSEHRFAMDAQPFDIVCNMMGGGVLVGQSGGYQDFRFYPNEKDIYRPTSYDYNTLNARDFEQRWGAKWYESSWFWKGNNSVYMLHLDNVGYVRRLKMYRAPIERVQPDSFLEFEAMEFFYERPDGTFNNGGFEFYGFDLTITSDNFVQRYHHVLTEGPEDIDISSASFTIIGDGDPYDTNRFYLKVLTGAKVPSYGNYELPIEMTWVFDMNERKMYRVYGGDNIQTLSLASDPKPIDSELTTLVNDPHIKSGAFNNKGRIVIRNGDGSYYIKQTTMDRRESPYILGIHDKLEDMKRVTPIYDGSSYLSGPWIVQVPNRVRAELLGAQIEIPPGFFDVREQVSVYLNQTIYMVISYRNGKPAFQFTLERPNRPEVLWVATITTDANQITDIVMKD